MHHHCLCRQRQCLQLSLDPLQYAPVLLFTEDCSKLCGQRAQEQRRHMICDHNILYALSDAGLNWTALRYLSPTSLKNNAYAG